MHSQLIDCTCANCGKDYRKRADRVRSPDYCDKECRLIATSRAAISERGTHCPGCGEFFVARRAQLLGGRKPYCSISCTAKYTPRTKEWSDNISRAQRGREAPSGPDHPQWNGGITLTGGYLRYSSGEHSGRGVHTVMLEEEIGRRIVCGEVVHHINHDPLDNRIENLQLMTRADHARHHMKDRRTQEQLISEGKL